MLIAVPHFHSRAIFQLIFLSSTEIAEDPEIGERSDSLHILLDAARGYANVLLEHFAVTAFRTPQRIFTRHAPDDLYHSPRQTLSA
jgi:hypothetical protein